MKILGLDPGFARLGFGVISAYGNILKHIVHGCIETKKEKTFGERLVEIGSELEKVIKFYKPDRIVVEKLFFTKNVKTAIAVGEARGVIFYVCSLRKIPIVELTPSQIKMGLTGYGNADKKQMQKMIKLQLCLKEIPKSDDAADALAVAICGSAMRL